MVKETMGARCVGCSLIAVAAYASLGCGADGVEDATRSETVRASSGVTVSDDGTGRLVVRAPKVTRRTLPEHEAFTLRAEQGLDDASSLTLDADLRSVTDETLERTRELLPETLVDVYIELEDPGFDFSLFHGVDDATRAALVAARTDELAPHWRRLEGALASIGGAVTAKLWLSNVVSARVKAADVESVAKFPGVLAVSLGDEMSSEAGWNGRVIRREVLLDSAALAGSKKDFYQGCFESPQDPAACHDGNTNSRLGSGTATRIAILEDYLTEINGNNNVVYKNHVGWLDNANGTSRIRKLAGCFAGNAACSTATVPTPTEDNHATQVTWVAAGSIEQGQDSNFPGTRTTAQRDRSGISKESSIYFYQTSGSGGVALAINQAVADGADVINMSQGTRVCSSTTSTFDSGGVNAALRNAVAAGVVVVKSAGDEDNTLGTCNITYPAWRPEVIAVASLDTSSSTNTNMNATVLRRFSSRGGATLRIRGSTANLPFSGIGLSAPGCIDRWFNNNSNGYASVAGSRCGTSFAAPVVSGTAVLLRDAINQIGGFGNWGGNDARHITANLLMFGDAWDGTLNADIPTGISDTSGYGRLHAHYLHSVNLSGPWWWSFWGLRLVQGQTYTFPIGDNNPESASAHLKWAVTWFDPDLANASNIVIYVTDACNNDQLIARDISTDFRKRIQLRSNVIGNRCLVANIGVITAPPEGIDVFTAYYIHTGDAASEH
jgi:hypothetical protein